MLSKGAWSRPSLCVNPGLGAFIGKQVSVPQHIAFFGSTGGAMTTLTICVYNVEEALIRKYAKLEGKDVLDFVRDAVIEKIEDQEDLKALCTAVAEDDGTLHSRAGSHGTGLVGGLSRGRVRGHFSRILCVAYR